jgi:hypothetical protein
LQCRLACDAMHACMGTVDEIHLGHWKIIVLCKHLLVQRNIISLKDHAHGGKSGRSNSKRAIHWVANLQYIGTTSSNSFTSQNAQLSTQHPASIKSIEFEG